MQAFKGSTHKQRLNVAKWDIEAATLIDTLLTLGVQCLDALVDLPATNEAGEQVLHGCNMQQMRLARHYATAARQLMEYEIYDKFINDLRYKRLKSV